MFEYELILTVSFREDSLEEAWERGNHFTAECSLNHENTTLVKDGVKVFREIRATVRPVVQETVRPVAPGYHLSDIKKGVLGDLSKIREELEEAEDANAQGVKLMELIELSDLYGALKARAEKLGSSIKDLEKMSEVTERAFKNGRR